MTAASIWRRVIDQRLSRTERELLAGFHLGIAHALEQRARGPGLVGKTCRAIRRDNIRAAIACLRVARSERRSVARDAAAAFAIALDHARAAAPRDCTPGG